MYKTFKVEKNGKTLEFKEGKTYYITDRYAWVDKENKYHMFPVIMKAYCIEQDRETEGVEFYLRTYEHLIPSDLPLGRYDHPENYQIDDWYIFSNTYSEAVSKIYKEHYKEDPNVFFVEIFEGMK